jgi:hypothetical protein
MLEPKFTSLRGNPPPPKKNDGKTEYLKNLFCESSKGNEGGMFYTPTICVQLLNFDDEKLPYS